MTNQEVNEFMQRFLDDDLSEDEAEKLLEHLKQSPASEAMFNRLVQLNDDLQQLPKVTPPISIVDSIIPQLEREGLWTSSMGQSGSGSGSASARFRFSGMMKWVSGVAVAGIALTVFITTMINNEDGNFANNNATSMEQDLGAAMSSIANESESGNVAFQMTDQYGDSKESASIEEEPLDVEDEVEGDSFLDFNASLGDRQQTGQPDTVPTTQSARVTVTSDSRSAGKPEKANETKSSVAANEPSKSKQPESDAAAEDNTNTIPEKRDTKAPSEPEQEELFTGQTAEPSDPANSDNTNSLQESEQESVSDVLKIEATDPLAYVSPNGAFIAKVMDTDGGKQVVIVDPSGHVQYRSQAYAGQVTSLSWFSDSKRLLLLISSSSTDKQVTIDAVNQSETALSE
jgi:hypothetical protein